MEQAFSDYDRQVISKDNIILTGLMGCGKTSVGEILSLMLGFGFVDTDTLIEKDQQKTISEIFMGESGEAKFRICESDVIRALKSVKNHVVAVGGGALLSDDNWELLQTMGTVVWLNTPLEEIARRIVMKPDEIRSRPLLSDAVNIESRADRFSNLIDRLKSILAERQERFEKAEIAVSDSYGTPEFAAYNLKERLLNLQ